MAFTKTKFCTISYKEKDDSIKEILKAIKNAEIENKKLFQINPNKYFIDIVYSNKEYDKKTGLTKIKTTRGGYVHNNRITIISPQVEKLPFDFKSFFYHEINHIFYITLIGSYHPVWFSEGMATYLMKTYTIEINGWKKFFRTVNEPEKYLYYRYIKKKYYDTAKEFYTLSFLVYQYLDKKYDEKIIMKLLKEFSKWPSKSKFDDLFKKYFKLTKKEIVQNAIK